MITVALDASTYAGSVCVIRDRDVLAVRDVPMRDSHAERLMPAVSETLGEADADAAHIGRIVCGAGPGSFTSLRIAAGIAKGLAMAMGKPLYSVSSLALMVGAVQPPPAPGEYVAALDALRGEHYVASCRVDVTGDVVDIGPVSLVCSAELESLEAAGHMTVGEGRRVPGRPNARGIVRATPLLDRDGPVDLAAWEPHYGRVAEAQRRWEAAHGRVMPRG
jgi:tRNA threonylcarbamoyladenosine biosynthesis protein TsaB